MRYRRQPGELFIAIGVVVGTIALIWLIIGTAGS